MEPDVRESVSLSLGDFPMTHPKRQATTTREREIDSANQVPESDEAISGTGLYCLYNPPSTSEISCTFVAVHGLNGDLRLSWTSHETGLFWLKDILPKSFPQSRISTFGYQDVLGAAANRLLWALVNAMPAVGELKPIIFIGHSAGGTLCKEVFIISSPNRNSRPAVQRVHAAIKGFVFLGTRHRGAFDDALNPASHLMRTKLLSWFMTSSEQKLSQISYFFSEYRRINVEFEQEGGEMFPMSCFYETLPTPRLGMVTSQNDSTLDVAWADDRPCEGTHPDMGRIDNETSQKWTQLLSGIRSVHDQALKLTVSAAPALLPTPFVESPVITNNEPSPEMQPGIRVLALDGGGIRGLFSIIVLEAIMEQVRLLDSAEIDDAPRPCDYFDLIGGTSTGGLLGIMLGRLRMDLVSCKIAYKSLSSSIFKARTLTIPGKRFIDSFRRVPWYSGTALESAVKTLVSERISQQEKTDLQSKKIDSSEALMKDPREKVTRTFVCATLDESPVSERFRTYEPVSTNTSAAKCSIWEASRATSAAPLYFPPIQIQGRKYWDGGMKSNNPILEVIREAKAEFGSQRAFQAIVSLGTGKARHINPSDHPFGVVQYAFDQMTNTEMKHIEFLANYGDLEKMYFRFNEEGDLHKIDLAEWRALDTVERLANEYVGSRAGKELIANCARRLARST